MIVCYQLQVQEVEIHVIVQQMDFLINQILITVNLVILHAVLAKEHCLQIVLIVLKEDIFQLQVVQLNAYSAPINAKPVLIMT